MTAPATRRQALRSTYPSEVVSAEVRHTPGWYDQSGWPYPAEAGDRLFVRCDGGPAMSRLETFPPRLELTEPGGSYALVDDGPPHEWVYHWVPDT